MVFSRRRAQNGNLLKMGGASLFVHVTMVFFLSLNPFPKIVKIQPTPYTVTLMPVSVQEPEIQKPSPPPVVNQEKPKPTEKPKKDDLVEKVKKPQKENKELKDLQKAIDEIRKKIAIDEIQRRVARREKPERRVAPVAPVAPLAPIVSSPQSSGGMEPILNQYYGIICAKIREEWTIPENLLKEKEMVDIETIIVLIIDRDGKIQNSWFEKKSGNTIYDQSAMRAIMKAEPFPSFPRELSEKTLEIGYRFFPD
jgi:outer membrane biosynthesis protein TonB